MHCRYEDFSFHTIIETMFYLILQFSEIDILDSLICELPFFFFIEISREFPCDAFTYFI